MSRNLVVVAIVVLALIAGGWLLMRSNPTTSPATSQPTSTPTSTESATPEGTDAAEMTNLREVTVSGSEFAFAPNSLSFKKGERIRLVFQNTGKMPHDLKIDELGVATKVIQAGQTDTVEFTVEKAGSFEMYCSVGNHRAQGMVGTVTVQ